MKLATIISCIKYFIYSVFIYLDIKSDLFQILVIFMCIDTLAGVFKVLKLNYKLFSMKRLMWGLISKFGLLIIPLIVALLVKALGQDLGIGVSLIVKILIVSEFLSSISNLYTVKTGIEVKDIDIFTMMFKFLRKKAIETLNRFFKTEIKIDENEQ